MKKEWPLDDETQYTCLMEYKYQIPTRSWTSVDDFLVFRSPEEVRAQVLGCDITLPDPLYSYSKVARGEMKIRGPIWGPAKEVRKIFGFDESPTYTKVDSVETLVSDDDKIIEDKSRSIFCLVISTGKAGYAIAVVADGDEDDVFIRVGLLEIYPKERSSVMENPMVRMIKIV